MSKALSTLVILFIIFIFSGLFFGMYQLSGIFTPKDEVSSVVANLNFILNVGEPIYIKKLQFDSIWPGQSGEMEITLENIASVNYTVHIKNKGFIAPNEKAILVDFDPVSISIQPNKIVKLNIPFRVKSGAPIGIYEIVVAIYRGKDIDNALLITEIHLIGYVGGEPIQVRKVVLPTLWPGSIGKIFLEVENIADIPYNITISVKDIKGPDNKRTYISIDEKIYLIDASSNLQLEIPVTLFDNAPVGTYTISINIKRI